jgi:hypothetical protein
MQAGGYRLLLAEAEANFREIIRSKQSIWHMKRVLKHIDFYLFDYSCSNFHVNATYFALFAGERGITRSI